MSKDIKEQIEFDKKCGSVVEFIINEQFKKEIYEQNKSTMKELTPRCREFVELCYKNRERFLAELERGKYPRELEKYIN